MRVADPSSGWRLLHTYGVIPPTHIHSGPPQKRLIVFFTPNGTIPDAWRPTGGERDFTLSTILSPMSLCSLQGDMSPVTPAAAATLPLTSAAADMSPLTPAARERF